MQHVRIGSLAQVTARRLGHDADRRQVTYITTGIDQPAVDCGIEQLVVDDVVEMPIVVVIAPTSIHPTQDGEVSPAEFSRAVGACGLGHDVQPRYIKTPIFNVVRWLQNNACTTLTFQCLAAHGCFATVRVN